MVHAYARAAQAQDGWDKADIIGKLLSGALLAAIAAVIKAGADDIAASRQTGELVQGLIADPTMVNQRTKAGSRTHRAQPVYRRPESRTRRRNS